MISSGLTPLGDTELDSVITPSLCILILSNHHYGLGKAVLVDHHVPVIFAGEVKSFSVVDLSQVLQFVLAAPVVYK